MSGNREVTRTGGCSVAMGGRRIEMKNRVRIAVVIALVLAAFSGCELYQAINVTWSIDGIAPLGGGMYRISYTVQNLGKIDLTGVTLKSARTWWAPDCTTRTPHGLRTSASTRTRSSTDTSTC